MKVRHIVMFDFSELDPKLTDHLVKGFEELKAAPGVADFEWGTENNQEDSAQGFTHCFFLTFNSFEKRNEYLISKEHRNYEKEVMKYRSKVLVFDYEVNK